VAWSLPQFYIMADAEHNFIHVGIGSVSPGGETINSTVEIEHTVMDSSGNATTITTTFGG